MAGGHLLIDTLAIFTFEQVATIARNPNPNPNPNPSLMLDAVSRSSCNYVMGNPKSANAVADATRHAHLNVVSRQERPTDWQ